MWLMDIRAIERMRSVSVMLRADSMCKASSAVIVVILAGPSVSSIRRAFLADRGMTRIEQDLQCDGKILKPAAGQYSHGNGVQLQDSRSQPLLCPLTPLCMLELLP